MFAFCLRSVSPQYLISRARGDAALQTGLVVEVSNISPSFARLNAPQTFILHLKGAYLWGSSQAIPIRPKSLLQPFTVDAFTVTCSPDSGPHSRPVSVMERHCLASPLSHILLLVTLSPGPSISVEMPLGLPGCPAAMGTAHSQLESLRSTSGEALRVAAVCIGCPALLSTENQEKMPSRLP